MLQFGTNEVIVGRGAQAQFVGLERRRDDRLGTEPLDRSSAIFEADGACAETEIWCDARVLQGAYRRGNSLSVGAGAARVDRDSFDTFRDWLTSNPQLNVAIRRENEYYAATVAGAARG